MNGKQEIDKMKKDRSYRKHTLRWRSTNCPFRSANDLVTLASKIEPGNLVEEFAKGHK